MNWAKAARNMSTGRRCVQPCTPSAVNANNGRGASPNALTATSGKPADAIDAAVSLNRICVTSADARNAGCDARSARAIGDAATGSATAHTSASTAND